jgi:uncharacterized protein
MVAPRKSALLETLPDYILPFLVATFVGAVIAGMCGFAFGLVASAVWLHFISPAQTVPLIAAYVIVIQCWGVWRLRRDVVPRRVLPLLTGGLIGIPIGGFALQLLPAAYIQLVTAAAMLCFGIYGLAAPRLAPSQGGVLQQIAVGVMSGMLGGSTGLAGIPTTIWTSLRGWSKDEQRAVYQPVTFVLFVVMLGWLGQSGRVTIDTVQLFFLGLPPLCAGTLLGWKLYGRFDDDTFRKAVLSLLLASGCALAYGVTA